MPFKLGLAKAKKTAKKPRGKRLKHRSWAKKTGNSMSIQRNGTLGTGNPNDPFPAMVHKKMVYAGQDIFSIQDSGGLKLFGTPLEFRLNSPFDPFVGVTALLNTSAYGFSEMATLYNRYKVSGVLIEVDWYDPSHDGLILGALLKNPGNNADTLNNENIPAVCRRPQAWTSAIVNTGEQKRKFQQYFPMHKLFNITKLQYDADIDTSTAGTTGDPGSSPHLQISIADGRGENIAKSVMFTVRLTYYTTFYQRKMYN